MLAEGACAPKEPILAQRAAIARSNWGLRYGPADDGLGGQGSIVSRTLSLWRIIAPMYHTGIKAVVAEIICPRKLQPPTYVNAVRDSDVVGGIASRLPTAHQLESKVPVAPCLVRPSWVTRNFRRIAPKGVW